MDIPSKNEAKAMLEQYPGTDGAYQMIKPLSYNSGLAAAKGLYKAPGFTAKYLKIQALYRKVLEKHLAEVLSLKAYDDTLAEHKLRFIPICNGRMNFYQKNSTFGYRYIYLRNNLPIERLSKENLDMIGMFINTHKADAAYAVKELAARTYPEIIMAYSEKPANTPIGYSNDGEKTALNRALVFEIGHSAEFDENGNFVDTANECKKADYLASELIPLMEKRISRELGEKVTIFSNWD